MKSWTETRDALITAGIPADRLPAEWEWRINLRDANLRDAKWGNITISRSPLHVSIPNEWAIAILDTHMQIGCELHSLSEWAAFDDSRIAQMDGRHALRFWRQYKAVLLAMAAADNRGVSAPAVTVEAA